MKYEENNIKTLVQSLTQVQRVRDIYNKDKSKN